MNQKDSQERIPGKEAGNLMFEKLVKSTDIEINGQRYALRYYMQKTTRGGHRYSCEVTLGAGDRIIVDDDSIMSLESKVARLAPATVYSRTLAGSPSEAA